MYFLTKKIIAQIRSNEDIDSAVVVESLGPITWDQRDEITKNILELLDHSDESIQDISGKLFEVLVEFKSIK